MVSMKRIKVWKTVSNEALCEVLAACVKVTSEHGRRTSLEVHDLTREVQAELEKRR